MRIALASSEGSSLISKDDALLSSAIRKLGGEAEVAIWSDPSIDWSKFDAVAVRTTWDYHQHLVGFLNWLNRIESATKIFNAPKLIHWNAHKSYLLELAKEG